MKLLLSRHGNTFNRDDKVTWVGARNDLPLTETGIAQADLLADALIDIGLRPKAIYCGPLLRTTEYASIVKRRLALDVDIQKDSRLNELDYGEWSGLSDSEVREKFGQEALTDWIERSIWPKNAGWVGSADQVTSEIRNLASNLLESHFGADDTVLLVSSSGRLRYFLRLIEGEFERSVEAKNFAVKTGNISLLTESAGRFSKLLWNVPPAVLRNTLSALS